MNETTEKRVLKALESIGWGLKRVAYVLESSTKGLPRSETPCARCGSYLLHAKAMGAEPHAACAVCELKSGVVQPDPAAGMTPPPDAPQGPHS